MDFLKGLNPPQRAAVEAVNGPLLILAGPGSGKTRVIVHRVAYLVKACGVRPWQVMAVTFTNKAAREMKERLNLLLKEDVQGLTVGTFHAFCAGVLRRDGEIIGLAPNFVIYDQEDQVGLVKQAIKELGVNDKQFPPRALLSAISSAKSELLGPEGYKKTGQSYFHEVVQRVYRSYQGLLLASRALDFDDLLMVTVDLFRRCPEVLASYQSRYLHILVDEFQDTNMVQYELVKLLAERHRNLCVVGDPDQSIYSWRNADIRNILNFEHDYPDARTVFLEQSYRSPQTILDVAHSVISANHRRKEKKLWTEKGKGAPIKVVEAYNEEDEARIVVAEIDKLVRQGSCRPSDCAIMYRTNAQSRAVEDAFVRYGLPYRLVAGTRFYERREVKDVIAYLRLIYNPLDSISLARIINVPSRGIGQRTIVELSRWATALGQPVYGALRELAQEQGTRNEERDVRNEERGTRDKEQGFGEGQWSGVKGQGSGTSLDPRPLTLTSRARLALLGFATMLEEMISRSHELGLVELIDYILDRTGYGRWVQDGTKEGDERWENIQELRTVAREFQDLDTREALAALLERVALVSDVDALDETVDASTLITLHAAKGLEFGTVFILGMEEGVLPHIRSFDNPEQMEEERRLCYVGITRAKDRLYLVRAQRRTLFGSSSPNPPSRFLRDIPPHLTEARRPGPDSPARAVAGRWEPPTTLVGRHRPETKASLALVPGDRVRHARFGEGLVVSTKPSGDDQEIAVAFDGAGVKRLLLSFAPLEKV
ncbi:MAG: UvrD-helicase domain-containing protein [Dehalococcoidia bacterium]|nr:UvrD-helicase domain-containing protein [Dehalococcoidia bacterium]